MLTHETVGEVFDHPVLVVPHPACDRPLVVPAPPALGVERPLQAAEPFGAFNSLVVR